MRQAHRSAKPLRPSASMSRGSMRRAPVRHLHDAAQAIAVRRGLTLDWLTRFDHAAVAMDASLVARLTRAAQRSRIPGPESRIPVMASGAGHDAMILAAHMPAAML